MVSLKIPNISQIGNRVNSYKGYYLDDILMIKVIQFNLVITLGILFKLV